MTLIRSLYHKKTMKHQKQKFDILDISGGIVRQNSKKLVSLIREIMFENSTHQ